jgi:hypothetical protein
MDFGKVPNLKEVDFTLPEGLFIFKKLTPDTV